MDLSRTRNDCLFDVPDVYEQVFCREASVEADFLNACFAKYSDRPVQTAFEPGCGGGRLLSLLADRGIRVSGIDQSQAAVDFANSRLADAQNPVPVKLADMANATDSYWSDPTPADAAFASVNTLRHLPCDRSVLTHLELMARVVRPGGVYVVDIQLAEDRPLVCGTESFDCVQNGLPVRVMVWGKRVENRQEIFGVSIAPQREAKSGPSTAHEFEAEIVYRTYTSDELRDVVDRSPFWMIAAEIPFGDGTIGSRRIDGSRYAFVLRRVSNPGADDDDRC